MENPKNFRASKFKKRKGNYKKFYSLTDNKVLSLLLIMISSPLWIPILLASFIVIIAFYIIIWYIPLLFSGLCVAIFILGLTGLIGIPFNSEVYYLISQSGISFLSLGLGLLFSILAVEIIKVAAKLSSLTTKHVINFIKY